MIVLMVLVTSIYLSIHGSHDFLFIETDHGKLFQVVYEKEIKHDREIESHVWSYRPRITLEHLTQSLQREKETIKDLSVLKEFLEKVSYDSISFLPVCWANVSVYMADQLKCIYFLSSSQMYMFRVSYESAPFIESTALLGITKKYNRSCTFLWLYFCSVHI